MAESIVDFLREVNVVREVEQEVDASAPVAGFEVFKREQQKLGEVDFIYRMSDLNKKRLIEEQE